MRSSRSSMASRGSSLRCCTARGCGCSKCLTLRAKDVDFASAEIRVRDGKGRRDRVVPLPRKLVAPLQTHLDRVRTVHREDLRAGFGAVALPDALQRK